MTCIDAVEESSRLEPRTLPGNRVGLLCFMGAHAGLGARDFETAWQAARTGLQDPAVLRYAQLRIQPPPRAPAGSPELSMVVDGIEEFWLRDEAAMSVFASPENLERLFAALPLSALTIVRFTEAPVVDALEAGEPTDSMIKRLVVLVRKEGWSHQQFLRHWVEVHRPLARAAAGRHSRYHQLLVLDHLRNPAGLRDHGVRIDGLSESWFRDESALLAGAATPQGQALIADNRLYVQASRKLFFHEFELPVAPAAPAHASRPSAGIATP
ncbi:MAG: EthD domain-containing protein [Lautropia sp.]